MTTQRPTFGDIVALAFFEPHFFEQGFSADQAKAGNRGGREIRSDQTGQAPRLGA